ncbi:MAG: type IV toxin-antitoxin system AbiEi family antitoxin domain-containing protein [Erysipelotrichaceae bacterium]|nr:type IV toxin-antitoxin system AbiEi family antitoxin domain-containing protein [Erysipelotrichaceae bacterium]
MLMSEIMDFIDDSGIILTSEVIRAGFTKANFYKFVKVHNFEQVAHGVYASPEAWADENYILSLRCPQAVFSHDEALYHYRLTDREPTKRTITVYTGYGTGRLLKDNICVHTIKKNLLEIGKTMVTTSFGHQIPMYDLERTICDLVRNRHNFEIQDYQTALRNYVTRTDKDLNRLMNYAKLFHVEKILREYMEFLL